MTTRLIQKPLSRAAARVAARADARRRKAVVIEVIDDGEYMYVRWVRDNGETVSAEFKLIGWSRAPEAIDRHMLEALGRGFCQVSHPRS